MVRGSFPHSDPERGCERQEVYQSKKDLCAKRDVHICAGRCQSMGMYPGAFQERTARATGGGLTWFTETAESFTCIV